MGAALRCVFKNTHKCERCVGQAQGCRRTGDNQLTCSVSDGRPSIAFWALDFPSSGRLDFTVQPDDFTDPNADNNSRSWSPS